ncbi:MAG: hypothetical protein ABI743_08680 [bacterium]
MSRQQAIAVLVATVFIMLLTQLPSMLGGPTLAPAAHDLDKQRIQQTKLDGRRPILYIAQLDRGNLKQLDALTIGDKKRTSLLTLNTAPLAPNEFDPLGIDVTNTLIVAGIQGQPKGTIQTLTLDTKRYRKAIGKVISEFPWTFRLYRPPFSLLAERQVAPDHWELAQPFDASPPVPMGLGPGAHPTRWLGSGPNGEAITVIDEATASSLHGIDLLNAKLGFLMSAGHPILGALVTSAKGAPLEGLAVSNETLPEGATIWHWDATGRFDRVVSLKYFDAQGFVPPGWPLAADPDNYALALRLSDVDILYGAEMTNPIYLVRDGQPVDLAQFHDEAEYAWVVNKTHLFWIVGGHLKHRDLESDQAAWPASDEDFGDIGSDYKIFAGPAVQ